MNPNECEYATILPNGRIRCSVVHELMVNATVSTRWCQGCTGKSDDARNLKRYGGLKESPEEKVKKLDRSVKCLHRGVTKSRVTLECCGDVDVFDCAKLKQEVYASKCRSCTEYEAPRREQCPLVFFCRRGDYRSHHTTFFTRPFAEEGYWIEHVELDPSKPLFGITEAVAKHGVPDAVIQWDEHSVVQCDKPWREVLLWAYDNKIVPLCIDFGYFGHYQHFMLDLYVPTGGTAIRQEWDDVSDADVDWGVQTPRIIDYHRRVSRGYNDASGKPPLIRGDYVAVYMQQHSALSRFRPFNNTDWLTMCTDTLSAKGLQVAIKTAPSTTEETKYPDNAHMFVHGEVPNDTNQRLAVHAKYCLIISSSISNEFLLNDLPVVATGRSWFNGLDVFHEPTGWDVLPDDTPVINQKARNKYSNWWLSKQFMSDESGPRLTQAIQEGRTRMEKL